MFALVVVFSLFFFFKQKTAYELRISDWSSTCALPILWTRPFGSILVVLRAGRQAVLVADRPHRQFGHHLRLVDGVLRLVEQVRQFARIGVEVVELAVAHQDRKSSG